MMDNVEKRDNMKAVDGIGLYKIRYEMDVQGSSRNQNYTAGVIAYTSKQAVDTLVKFAANNIKGFKGLKTEEVSFDGACHALSDEVKQAIIGKAIMDGIVISKDDHDALIKEANKTTKKTTKRSVIPKDKE